jgi:HEAT repeat protein
MEESQPRTTPNAPAAAANPTVDMNATARAAAAATTSDWPALAELVAHDADPRVRAVALARLVGNGPPEVSRAVWTDAAADADPRVRLRAAQVAPRLGRSAANATLLALLADADPWVIEAAAYALGEHPRPSARAIAALTAAATSHPDPLVREAAVAALGAIGDPATLPAVLHACDDKPAIRRRAVLALAAFDGEEVEARLRLALEDRDWQVRQAAEDLRRE